MSHTALLAALGLHPLLAPDAPALFDGQATVTRRELVDRARTQARRIRHAVPPHARIGVVDTHDAHVVVSVVAAFLAQRSLALLGAASPDALLHLASNAGCLAVLDGGDLHLIPAPIRPELTTDHGLGPHDPPEAAVIFTSGTTGHPRGVRLSTTGFLANLVAMNATAPPWPDGVRLGQMLSTTHSFGLSMLLLALTRRASVVMLPTDAGRPLIHSLGEHGIGVFACVPFTLRLLARRRLALGTATTPQLAILLLAGGGIAEDELAKLAETYHGDLLYMYGFTETTARATVRRPGRDSAPPGSVGLPLPGTHVEIVDATGSVLPPGSPGLIRVHSPALMIGYLGDPVRERGEPVTTSDLGLLDDAGHLTITGRLAEMRNFRGTRVSLVDLETAASRLDGVHAARAVPDSAAEDAACVLHVIVAEGTDLAAVRSAVIHQIRPRGIVRDIQEVTELPVTSTGKILRRTLR